MQAQSIELGRDVYGNDGEKIGSVDRLVLNSENQHLEAIVTDVGIFSAGKVIDLDLVGHADADRIVLNLTKEQAEQMPDFVSTQFIDAPVDALAGYPGWAPGAVGFGRVLYGAPSAGVGYPAGVAARYPDYGGTAPVVENVRNIPEQDVVVDAGSDVVGADGKKVGTVDRVVYGDNGVIESVVVKAGFLFKHEVAIPGAWVAELDDDRILLNVAADEAGA
jgi:uncharacterized protein YrrD